MFWCGESSKLNVFSAVKVAGFLRKIRISTRLRKGSLTDLAIVSAVFPLSCRHLQDVVRMCAWACESVLPREDYRTLVPIRAWNFAWFSRLCMHYWEFYQEVGNRVISSSDIGLPKDLDHGEDPWLQTGSCVKLLQAYFVGKRGSIFDNVLQLGKKRKSGSSVRN